LVVNDTLSSPPSETSSSHLPEVPANNVKDCALANSKVLNSPESSVKVTDLDALETSATVPVRKMNVSFLSVDSMNKRVDEILHCCNSEADFSQEISHDILMFLLWTYRYGLNQAIAKAERLRLPLPLSLCEALASFVYSREQGKLKLPEVEVSAHCSSRLHSAQVPEEARPGRLERDRCLASTDFCRHQRPP
jgi:hypothetical protein